MTKIVIDRPSDPLSSMIERRRDAYARKWRLPTSRAVQPVERDPAASMPERRISLADKITAIWAAHGYGRG